MKKFISMFISALLALAACCVFVSCNEPTPPAGEGGLTKAEISSLYSQIASDAWEKIDVAEPTEQAAAVSLMSVTDVPDKTVEATDANAIKNVKLNAVAMPAFLKMLSNLYANDNFVLSDGIVKFNATITLGGQQFAQKFALTSSIDQTNGKVYFEVTVEVNGATQYNLCDIDYDFTAKKITAFRYCAAMPGFFADMKVDAQDKMYIYQTSDAADAFAVAISAKKTDFETSSEQGQVLTADFSSEVQSYMDTVNAAMASFRN